MGEIIGINREAHSDSDSISDSSELRMSNRRRFRGYCPPAKRKASKPQGEYTTSLSLAAGAASFLSQPILQDATVSWGVSAHARAKLPAVVIRKNRGDNDSDGEDLTDDGAPEVRRRRRRGRGQSTNSEYTTSLSCPNLSTGANSQKWKEGIDLALALALSDDPSVVGTKGLRKRRNLKNDVLCNSPSAAELDSDTNSTESVAYSDDASMEGRNPDGHDDAGFTSFRINYLIVHIAIMLADGLQGTHLYVLYEGYGYSVSSLYCLGFMSGAVTSPFTGPIVDRIGRKNAAMLYCALEMLINFLEQFNNFNGLIISRVIGGITTNLLFTVFESWLVTEHRARGFKEEKLETILRDSVIVSNLAAIASGYLAHVLAERLGPVGPFEGAVTCTGFALILVMFCWTENYGSDAPGIKSMRSYMKDALNTIVSDSKISRIGVIQGLTEGALQTFVFLWSPALQRFSGHAPTGTWGLDDKGEPAYGLIFGAFMACGVVGGLSSPLVRKLVTYLVSSPSVESKEDVVEIEGEGEVKPIAVEFMASSCYTLCAALLITPYLLPQDGEYSFSISLLAFLFYEFTVGLYMPCEGVIRSIYMPNSSICSLMTMLRVIVNVAVAAGVISTNFISFKTAFASVSCLMVISATLQLTLVSSKEWASVFGHVDKVTKPARRFSRSVSNSIMSKLVDIPDMRNLSDSSVSVAEDFELNDEIIHAKKE
eukprot:scaffold153220_cov68-Attheya_sp.AAC.4